MSERTNVEKDAPAYKGVKVRLETHELLNDLKMSYRNKRTIGDIIDEAVRDFAKKRQLETGESILPSK
ncbi:hypothetical protein QU577_27595 [Priestia megaterium]|uniref:hypothetical protein n=1 Tax=Priestia megaterium TaxID=1404 RepID=UPI0025B0FC03|nr:hypothetical protein [Priestia megaterium]MDN3365510.1 hypothetical protein [Priestia megaterium]